MSKHVHRSRWVLRYDGNEKSASGTKYDSAVGNTTTVVNESGIIMIKNEKE